MISSKFKTFSRTLALAATLGCAALAQASPITFLFDGLATGTFTPTGGQEQSFSGTAVSVSILTDTINIDTTRFGAGIPATNSLVQGQISLSGLGSGTFNLPLYVFDNHNKETVGFGDLFHNDLINLIDLNAGFDTYNLDTAFGPSAPGNGTDSVFISQFVGVGTSFGMLTLTGLRNLTFEAVTGDNNPVPEPGALALAALGLSLLYASGQRRRS